MLMLEWLEDNPYTCPVLMAVQSIVLRQSWKYTYRGWTLMQGPHSAAACMWPRWLTTLEYRFWATRLGLAVRVLAGHQQREYRLKVDQELGALKEERREMEDSCKCLYEGKR